MFLLYGSWEALDRRKMMVGGKLTKIAGRRARLRARLRVGAQAAGTFSFCVTDLLSKIARNYMLCRTNQSEIKYFVETSIVNQQFLRKWKGSVKGCVENPYNPSV